MGTNLIGIDTTGRGGEIRAEPVSDTSANTLHRQLLSQVGAGSTVYSDEYRGFQGIDAFFKHETVKHSAGEYVKHKAHTNSIESFWLMTKQGYEGVYYKIPPKHLYRYVNEFTGRRNIRQCDILLQMVDLVRNFEGKRMTYEQLMVDNPFTVGVA